MPTSTMRKSTSTRSLRTMTPLSRSLRKPRKSLCRYVHPVHRLSGYQHLTRPRVSPQILSTHDDPELPVWTFRALFLGVGLSAFGAVLATIYTFKPQVRHLAHQQRWSTDPRSQNASVSQLFCLIIAYVLGTAMHAVMPTHGWWRYLNPGPFNIKGKSR